MNIMTHTLKTKNLFLRPPVIEDYDAYADYVEGGRLGDVSLREAAEQFYRLLEHWETFDFGMWAVCEQGRNTVIGLVGPFFPKEFDEREIGWHIFDGFEGKSIAYESAIAARLDAYQRLGWDGAVSYIPPENTRSIKLAERLGAFHDKKTTASHDPDCLVYRHPTLKELS